MVKIVCYLYPEALSKNEALNQFILSRKAIQKFIDLDLPLRSHFGKSSYGPADTYQLMLVIAGHSMRHHHQMLEVLKAYKEL